MGVAAKSKRKMNLKAAAVRVKRYVSPQVIIVLGSRCVNWLLWEPIDLY